jgi:light-regulated signal transduction histidine kinase (bacteriophytochrome)
MFPISIEICAMSVLTIRITTLHVLLSYCCIQRNVSHFVLLVSGSYICCYIGIGLFISKSIIEAHGGRMWAENNANGKGATFAFSLPLNELTLPGN